MPSPEPDIFAWRTSSYSGTGADCVEVAPAPERVLVRDSKDPDGSVLTLPTAAWRTFLTTLTGDHRIPAPHRDDGQLRPASEVLIIKHDWVT